MCYTKEVIIRIVEEEEIEFIRMQFVDIFGQLKNVAITANQIEKESDIPCEKLLLIPKKRA